MVTPRPRLYSLQAFLDRHLGHDVQADGRLVEQQELGLMQQGGDQLHFHALAQRQLADRLARQLLDMRTARSARRASD